MTRGAAVGEVLPDLGHLRDVFMDVAGLDGDLPGVAEGGGTFEQGQAVLPRVGVGDEVSLVVIL